MDRLDLPALRGRSPAAAVAVAYALAAVGWLVIVDEFAAGGASDPAHRLRWGAINHGGFALVTAIGLYLGLRGVQRQREAMAARARRVEARARELVETSPDAILVVAAWGISYANPSAARLLGAEGSAALARREVLELLDPQDRASFAERIGQVGRGLAAANPSDWTMRRVDGTAFRAEVAVARLSDEEPVAVQLTIRDVTAAWRLRREVERTTAALRTLGAVNEAVVRTGSERELVAEVCRVAVELGGYRAAWVALADPAEGGQLVQVASHGLDAGMLARVGLDWKAGVRPGGPVSRGHLEGRPVLVNDFAGDPTNVQYRGGFAVLGWGSSGSWPLRLGAERLGVLTIIASEPGAFDDRVAALLGQLADDLAIGLAGLRTRAALASERAFLDGILDNAGVLIGVLDERGVLLRANKHYERLLGRPLTEFVGRPVWETMLPPDLGAWYREQFQELWPGPYPRTVDGAVVTRSGEIREIEWTHSSIAGPDGRHHLLVGIGHDVNDRRLAEGRLRESREQLRALADRLQTVREEEKGRIARDLHDELGQLLTALQMELRWLERRVSDLPCGEQVNLLVDRLVGASELADQTVAAVQRIALELRPGALDRLGLVPALRQELRRFQERTGLRCEASLDEAAEPPPEVATALYRICQEALTNVSRHAGARRVEVRLACEPGALVLLVEDDGRGLEGQAPGPEALGLLGMTERATMLGGEVSFARRPEGGTAVTTRIPIEKVEARR